MTKLDFNDPFMVKGGHKMLKDFDKAKELFTAESLMSNEYLEENTKLDYWPAERPRQVQSGNAIYFNDPLQVGIRQRSGNAIYFNDPLQVGNDHAIYFDDPLQVLLYGGVERVCSRPGSFFTLLQQHSSEAVLL